MNALLIPILGSLIRHAAVAGGAAAVVNGDVASQAAGAIATLAGILWSVYQGVKASKAIAAAAPAA